MKRKLRLGRFTEKELAIIEKLSDVAKERFLSLDKKTQKKLLERAVKIAKQQHSKDRTKKNSKRKMIQTESKAKNRIRSSSSPLPQSSPLTRKQLIELSSNTLNTVLAGSSRNPSAQSESQENGTGENGNKIKSPNVNTLLQLPTELPQLVSGINQKNRETAKSQYQKKELQKKAREKKQGAGFFKGWNKKKRKKPLRFALSPKVTKGKWMVYAAIILCVLLLVLILAFVSIFMAGSDTDSSGYQCQVSEKTESYRVLVSEYCDKYDIGDYVDLCLAVMEQESGGRGIDVMQAEQSYYNKKPPIDTAEESIDCGVHEISDCLKKSKAAGPDDITLISLALQGYNFGNGYIDWAVKNYGGYSADNANLFSAKMCSSLHLSSYGDVEYVPHVLRYYVPNAETKVTNKKAAALIKELKENNTASDSVWKVIEKGASLTGTVTYGMLDPPRQDDGRDSPTVLDCSSFVAWSFHKSGYTGIPYTSTTKTFIESKKFETIEASELAVGDIGLKSATAPTGGANHVGIYCGKLKNGTKVWLHCTSKNGQSLTGNSSGVLMSPYTNFTYFRRLKKWKQAS